MNFNDLKKITLIAFALHPAKNNTPSLFIFLHSDLLWKAKDYRLWEQQARIPIMGLLFVMDKAPFNFS